MKIKNKTPGRESYVLTYPKFFDIKFLSLLRIPDPSFKRILPFSVGYWIVNLCLYIKDILLSSKTLTVCYQSGVRKDRTEWGFDGLMPGGSKRGICPIACPYFALWLKPGRRGAYFYSTLKSVFYGRTLPFMYHSCVHSSPDVFFFLVKWKCWLRPPSAVRKTFLNPNPNLSI